MLPESPHVQSRCNVAWGSEPVGFHLRHLLEPEEAGGNSRTVDHFDNRLFSTVLLSTQRK